MAIHAPLLDNDFITPETFAKIMQPLSPGATVAGPEDLKVTKVSDTKLRIAPGVAMVGGVFIENDSNIDVTIPAPTAVNAEFALLLRVNVEAGEVEPVLLPFTATGSIITSGTPSAASINRITGVMYDILIALYGHRIDNHYLGDTRVWGGKAGPYIVPFTQTGDVIPLLDIPIDSTVTNEGSETTRTWRKTASGAGAELMLPLTLQEFDKSITATYNGEEVTLTAWQEDPVFVRIIGAFTGETGGTLSFSEELSLALHYSPGFWQSGHVSAADGTGATLLTAAQTSFSTSMTLNAAGTGTRVINLDLRLKGALH